MMCCGNYKFQELVLDRLFLSGAQVERVFLAQRKIHTKIRSSLSPDNVEKILYVRYNGRNFDMCRLQTNLTGDEAAEDVEELEQPVQFLDFKGKEML